MAYVKIRPRRSTPAEWNYDNPVLAEGEMAVEVPITGVGTGFVNVKFGDGVTHWKDIPYGLIGDAESKKGEYFELENRMGNIEKSIKEISDRLVVSNPDIVLIEIEGTPVGPTYSGEARYLEEKVNALEEEIESLQTVLLLMYDAS